jgi:MFS family permease
MLGAAVSIIGAVLQASSFSLGQLIVGRLVSGFGLGALTATAPNWQTECSKSVHRGKAVLMLGTFNGVGLSIASWVNFGMSYAAGNVAWRFPLALPALWSTIIIVILAAFDLPESPRWLVKKGRIQEARVVLSLLFDTTPDAPEISFDIQEMEMSLAMAGEARFLDIFRNGPGRLFHRTCLAASGQVFQQMNGINALAYYMATIFQEYLGLSGEIASILAAVSFMWLAVCAPMGVLTVDTFGRRKLMLFGAMGMGLCMALIAGCLSQPANRAAIIATATFMFLFYLFFATGFFGITFLYAAEVAPLSHRVPITSISTGCAWLFNFVVAEVTPVGLASINWKYYIVYACINLFLIFPSE